MRVKTVHTAALAKMTKPAVVHPGKILPGKLLFSLSIHGTLHKHPTELSKGRTVKEPYTQRQRCIIVIVLVIFMIEQLVYQHEHDDCVCMFQRLLGRDSERSMALTVEKLLGDARLLITRLKEQDTNTDTIMSTSQVLHKRIEAMKQVKRKKKTFC